MTVRRLCSFGEFPLPPPVFWRGREGVGSADEGDVVDPIPCFVQ
jgi:hypothetical protein